MNTQNESDFKVEIERKKDDIIIRVIDINIDKERKNFDSAYKLVTELYLRIQELDAAMALETRVLEAKSSAATLWITEGKITKLSKQVKRNSYRIALSLLKAYPECLREVDIVSEIDTPRETVNDQLRGNVKSVAPYFMPCDGGYTLTNTGIDWVIKEVIPKNVV